MLPGYLSEKGMLNGRKGGGEREVLFVGKMRGGNWKPAGAGGREALFVEKMRVESWRLKSRN
jgi:hypothetical protein